MGDVVLVVVMLVPVALTVQTIWFRGRRGLAVGATLIFTAVTLFALAHAFKSALSVVPKAAAYTPTYWEAYRDGVVQTQGLVNRLVLPLAVMFASLTALALSRGSEKNELTRDGS